MSLDNFDVAYEARNDSAQNSSYALLRDAYKPEEANSKISTDLNKTEDSKITDLFGTVQFFDSGSDLNTANHLGGNGSEASANKIEPITSPDGSIVIGVGPIEVTRKWPWEKEEKQEKPQEAPKPAEPALDLNQERTKTLSLVEEKFGKDSPEAQQFKKDMDAVEHRNPPLSPEELAKLYHAESRLLEAKGDKPTDEKQRKELAAQIMHKAADPSGIAQGYHGTCQTTTMEARMYHRNPSAAAELVADLATTGEHKLPNGKTLTMDASQMKPQDGFKPGDSGYRDASGQMFQVAAINIGLMEHGYNGMDPVTNRPYVVEPGKVRYEQVKPSKENPTGERLVNVSDPDHPIPIIETSPGPPGVQSKDLADVYDLISNKKPGDSHPVLTDTASELETPDGKGIIHVKSQADLERIVKEAKEKGQLPITVAVDAGKSPFDKDAGQRPDEGSLHAVLITDVHTGPNGGTTFDVQNPWGKHANHTGDNAISSKDMFNAMSRTDSSAMSKNLKQLEDSMHIYGNDDEKIFQVLENKTPAQLQEMDRLWRERHGGQSLEEYLSDKMWTSEPRSRALKALQKGVPLKHPEKAAA